MKLTYIIILSAALILLTFGLTKYFSPTQTIKSDKVLVKLDESGIKALQHSNDSLNKVINALNKNVNNQVSEANKLDEENSRLKGVIVAATFKYDTTKGLPAKLIDCDSLVNDYKTALNNCDNSGKEKDSAIVQQGEVILNLEAENANKDKQIALKSNETGIYKSEAKVAKRKLAGAKIVQIFEAAAIGFLGYKLLTK